MSDDTQITIIVLGVAWTILGLLIYFKGDILEEMEEMTYPQFFFIGFVLGPIVFIGTVGVFIYNMLGKINWK